MPYNINIRINDCIMTQKRKQDHNQLVPMNPGKGNRMYDG